jgi:hypothetical protein
VSAPFTVNGPAKVFVNGDPLGQTLYGLPVVVEDHMKSEMASSPFGRPKNVYCYSASPTATRDWIADKLPVYNTDNQLVGWAEVGGVGRSWNSDRKNRDIMVHWDGGLYALAVEAHVEEKAKGLKWRRRRVVIDRGRVSGSHAPFAVTRVLYRSGPTSPDYAALADAAKKINAATIGVVR